MKILFASLALATATVSGAAHAADGAMEKCCCCEKMKREGKSCCGEEAEAPKENHSGHCEHRPEKPAN